MERVGEQNELEKNTQIYEKRTKKCVSKTKDSLELVNGCRETV